MSLRQVDRYVRIHREATASWVYTFRSKSERQKGVKISSSPNHFTDEKIMAQGGESICPSLHSKQVAKPKLELRYFKNRKETDS